MQQWEYTSLRLSELPRRTDEIDWLNDVGKEGRELVNITINKIAYLKRQVGRSVATPPAERKSAAG